MSAESLLLAVLASITALAMMTTLNTRGKWRFTISAMFSACLLGGTVWLFMLQYSSVDKDEAQSDGRRLNLKNMLPSKQDKARQLSALLEEADDFASELERAQLYIPSYTHEQLVARANALEEKFETLLSEVNDSKPLMEKYLETAKPVNDAMDDLKGACHLFKSYYYAENTDGELAAARLMRQKAHSAREMLIKAIKTVNANEKKTQEASAATNAKR